MQRSAQQTKPRRTRIGVCGIALATPRLMLRPNHPHSHDTPPEAIVHRGAGVMGFLRLSEPTLHRIKVALTLVAAILCLGVAGTALWLQDLRYSLPTPRPKNLASVAFGTVVPVAQVLPDLSQSDTRPLLLHFFNPDCPCSRFNTEHIRKLYQQYHDQVRFVAVVQVEEELSPAEHQKSAKAISQRLGGMEAVVDHEGRVAAAYGVYSTPQAVVLSPTGQLVFRGNYNVSRYCTDEKTEFARVVLGALLDGRNMPELPIAATTAYGCQLPTVAKGDAR